MAEVLFLTVLPREGVSLSDVFLSLPRLLSWFGFLSIVSEYLRRWGQQTFQKLVLRVGMSTLFSSSHE